jgi:hypothetical protein
MNCCANCFQDKELIGFVLSNSTEVSNCDFCNTQNTKVIDPRELEELFQPLISIFGTTQELNIPETEGRLLHDILQENWHIFNIEPSEVRKHLIATILSGVYRADSLFLNSNVSIRILFNNAVNPDAHELRWSNLAEEIKYKNRFFLTETIDLNLLSQLLSYLSKKYDVGKIFYRARVSSPEGFENTQMGKPPADKATSGRANPFGISYLYVSTKLETTLYESRSSYLDFITIGEFRLVEPLQVISLRNIHKDISPFVLGDRLENFIIHQKYLLRLEQELSRPIRRFDKELDYLPSQYLCEYVKSLGFDAIEYGSSLDTNGINLAIFNDNKLTCRGTKVYEITNVNLEFTEKQIERV